MADAPIRIEDLVARIKTDAGPFLWPRVASSVAELALRAEHNGVERDALADYAESTGLDIDDFLNNL